MTHYDSVLNLSMRQIQVFLQAAKTGSFTRAGEKLFMTQSMVSKSVAALEKHLCLTLFIRKPHGISLTPAGRLLYQSWKTLMQGMVQSVAAADAAQQGATEPILITDFSTSVQKEYLWPQVHRFHAMYPEIEILLEVLLPGQGLDRLETNNCDIVFAPYCELPLFEQYGAEWRLICPCQKVVWVHKSNPLYQRESLTVPDLKNETFIIVSPLVLTHYERMVLETCRMGGFEPENVIRVADVGAATMNLKLGKGVIIRDNIFDSVETSDIKKFTLPGTRSGTVMAWRKDLSNRSALNFIALYNK